MPPPCTSQGWQVLASLPHPEIAEDVFLVCTGIPPSCALSHDVASAARLLVASPLLKIKCMSYTCSQGRAATMLPRQHDL